MESFILQANSKECSYCHSEMIILKDRIKRPIPNGAKDLGLYDELYVWKCSKCDLKEKIQGSGTISLCICGQERIEPYHALCTDSMAVKLKINGSWSTGWETRSLRQTDGCSECIKCCVYREFLRTHDLQYFEIYSGSPEDGRIMNHYLHCKCAINCPDAEKKIKAGEWDYIDPNYGFVHPDDEAQRKSQREQTKQHKSQTTDTMLRRSRANLCVMCGAKFEFFEKKVNQPTDLMGQMGVTGFVHTRCRENSSYRDERG